jgi:hypothetical protein
MHGLQPPFPPLAQQTCVPSLQTPKSPVWQRRFLPIELLSQGASFASLLLLTPFFVHVVDRFRLDDPSALSFELRLYIRQL